MKNVTITLSEDAAQWARLEAARKGTSVSRLVGNLLAQHMSSEVGYERSMSRFLGRKSRPLKKTGGYPRREDLHERARFR